MSPTVLQASQFAQQLDAAIRTAPGGGTCAQKKGHDSLIDYMLCPQPAIPVVKDLCQVKTAA
eukprot:5801715-Pyramimonas_sp.AAC.1